jgi:hypothetical protein
MEDLEVTPEYLEELAEKQDESTEELEDAASSASGIGSSVWMTHGLICGGCGAAVTRAEAAHAAACKAMQAVSTDLAEKLREAEDYYEDTDDQAAANLDKQVRN